MIENAKRQLILILAVAAIAAAFVVTKDIRLGPDLQGGTELIYEVDIDRAKRDGLIPRESSDTDVDRVMNETVSIMNERIDPTGAIEAGVFRRGKTGILIELPAMEKTELDGVAKRVSELGSLEMRIVANTTYDKEDVKFDIPAEKKKLQDWIAEGENRAMLAEDPSKITQFNTTLGNDNLKWYPQVIKPSVDNPAVWSNAAGRAQTDAAVVAAFEAETFNGGRVREGLESLIAYFPINMKERHFTGEDLNAAGVRATVDEAGRPALGYVIKNDRRTDYADWSEEHVDERSAIILNGQVYSAPVFQGRIPGNGIIQGDFTQREVSGLIKVLKTGSLKVIPIETSRRTIGASLGQKAVQIGMWSIAIGGLCVLAFILYFYRLAGLVAFTAIALNIFLIYGIINFIEATLTLPGIAGLVLTMGMAVDANILIYERIREELAGGKELEQAARVGFERAMVTILDANITTFLGGLVLFNVGVGPIRGFAVTLMIGILTSVFTAFFASRLVFHYLLQNKILTSFNAKSVLSNLKIDFLKYAERAFVVSAILMVASLVTFTTVPTGTKLGLDFTGGAQLRLVFAKPITVAQLRSDLGGSEFAKQYPSWSVNTIGQGIGEDDPTDNFNIKIKLTPEQRASIEKAREDAAANAREFEAPYIATLTETMGDSLVHKAFEKASVSQDIEQASRQFARIDLNFSRPVKVQELETAVRESYGEDPNAPNAITLLDEGSDAATEGSRFTVEYSVPAGDSAATLGANLAEKLRASLKSADGSEIALSDPIPESEEIGGRMVGELRNAAIGALIIALFLIVMFIRLRFHEYKYGFGAVAALVHDVLITLGIVVLANAAGLVNAELNLAMIAAFLTIIGYSINDTIVIFDRIRENLNTKKRLGESIDHAAVMNLSINQTLSRTILTTATTLFVVVVQFVFNYNSGSSLEGFSFALIIGLLSGTYSTIFIATPVVLWLRDREDGTDAASDQAAA